MEKTNFQSVASVAQKAYSNDDGLVMLPFSGRFTTDYAAINAILAKGKARGEVMYAVGQRNKALEAVTKDNKALEAVTKDMDVGKTVVTGVREFAGRVVSYIKSALSSLADRAASAFSRKREFEVGAIGTVIKVAHTEGKVGENVYSDPVNRDPDVSGAHLNAEMTKKDRAPAEGHVRPAPEKKRKVEQANTQPANSISTAEPQTRTARTEKSHNPACLVQVRHPRHAFKLQATDLHTQEGAGNVALQAALHLGNLRPVANRT
jgi:hypothetical protein